MHAKEYTKVGLADLNAEAWPDGKLKILPYSFWQTRNEHEIACFLHDHGIYVLPTQELIDWLQTMIIGTAIEIGAGNGAIGRALNIPICDNKMQEWPHIRLAYEAMRQPTIQYPSDIECIDANEAVKRLKPHTVIGAFITHRWNGVTGNADGPDEHDICDRVIRYINIGNAVTHKEKSILHKRVFVAYEFPWLITRGVYSDKNRIWVFDNHNSQNP